MLEAQHANKLKVNAVTLGGCFICSESYLSIKPVVIKSNAGCLCCYLIARTRIRETDTMQHSLQIIR